MKYSKATDYALHTMLYLFAASAGKAVGVRTLADIQGVSPTYLSKILTKLVKAGFVESTPGVNGGYKLTKGKEEVSFLDIIHAIEGPASLFQCSLEHEGLAKPDCVIQAVMMKAEHRMEQYLMESKVSDLVDKVDESLIALINNATN